MSTRPSWLISCYIPAWSLCKRFHILSACRSPATAFQDGAGMHCGMHIVTWLVVGAQILSYYYIVMVPMRLKVSTRFVSNFSDPSWHLTHRCRLARAGHPATLPLRQSILASSLDWLLRLLMIASSHIGCSWRWTEGTLRLGSAVGVPIVLPGGEQLFWSNLHK